MSGRNLNDSSQTGRGSPKQLSPKADTMKLMVDLES